MEDIRTYREQDQDERRIDDEREYAAASEDEVPFHVPRD